VAQLTVRYGRLYETLNCDQLEYNIPLSLSLSLSRSLSLSFSPPSYMFILQSCILSVIVLT